MAAQGSKKLASKKSAPSTRSPGFLERLVSLFESDDPERKKQRQLREIVAELKRNRSRYYNPIKGMAEPGLARFFWEIYKAVAAAQVLLKGAEVSGALKMTLVDFSLGEEQLLLKERLSEKAITERANKGADPATIETEVKQDLKMFIEGIDIDWMNEIDAVYNRLLVLLDLIGFDYFFLLKRFDIAMPERDFAYAPHFESIDAALVQDDVQDFLEILPNIDTEANWERILTIIKEHRGMEVVSRDALRRAFQVIRDMQKSAVMLLMVRHLLQNPGWKPMVRTHRERIVEPYIARIKAEAETSAQKVATGKRNEQLQGLARQVFGSGSVSRLTNYSESANTDFAQKMMGGFLYVTALNYLRAFLVDYLPKSIREVVDLLIIKGKWTNNTPSQQMSEAFHQLLKVSETISRFDADLAEDGELGRKLKTFALRADRDKQALIVLRGALRQVNDEARTMLGDSSQHFVAVARVLKLAHEDIGKPNPAYLMNWKELKPSGDRDLRSLITGVYKKIYNFVQLIQMYR
ncbi:MAG: DUF5312 family protein [Spirochaetia bacterium]|jgi:hypothetical protein